MNNSDSIREKILEFLYDINRKCRSPNKAALGIKKIQSELKVKFSYTQQEVSSNINYLIDRKWVIKEITRKEFVTPGGNTTYPESIKYRITAEGIDYIEGPSQFKASSITGININNISGVVTVGDNNTTIVKQKYEPLYKELEILHRKILDNKNIVDETKLNLASDIESINSQLSKENPSQNVIKTLWDNIAESVKSVAELNNCVQLSMTISSLIQRLFG